jgi:hypothetical protein
VLASRAVSPFLVDYRPGTLRNVRREERRFISQRLIRAALAAEPGSRVNTGILLPLTNTVRKPFFSSIASSVTNLLCQL